jgi:RNA polymerase sigma factor (sigma-70 family)
MATSLQKFLRGLTRDMMAESLTGQSDRELVERFLAERNEAAFEAIVRRHGPMVYRVCFRILQQSQDAEDAFQATFLVLAQKLCGLHRQASLASWLHGVAHRVALKARVQAAVRRRHERQMASGAATPPDEMSWGELRMALDAELRGLPEKWRQPLILCYLEGRTQDEAAGQLGWSKNTLRRRLEEAREALGRRLRWRGVWPAALSGLLLSDCVTTAAPAAGLIAATVDTATRFAFGQPASAASAKAIALSRGIATAMTLTKSKWAMVLVLVLALAGSAVVATHRSLAEPPQGPADEEQVGEKQTPDRKMAALTGNWVMVLPAGFRYEVNMRRLAPDRYALENAVRFSGTYERRRDRLVMVEPAGRGEGGFEWEIAEDCLILIKQRPVEKLGSDYRGATLKRPAGAGNKGREPAAATENWDPTRIEGGFMFKDAAAFRSYMNKADIIAVGTLTRRGDKDGAVKVEKLPRGQVKGDTLHFVFNGGLIAAKEGDRVVVLLETGNGPARLHAYCGAPGLFRYSAWLAARVRSAQAPGFASPSPRPGPSPDEGRLDVHSGWSQDGGRITSEKDNGNGTKVLHGVQVIVGPKNWLKEYAVYNNGSLEQRTQFYPSGRIFREQRREHNGDGQEIVWSPEPTKVVAKKLNVADGTDIGPIKVQEVICQGTVKADKRWEGTFLVWETIPERPFEERLAVLEYTKGKLIKSTPLSAKKLGLPENVTMHDGWLWNPPDWPVALQRRSR